MSDEIKEDNDIVIEIEAVPEKEPIAKKENKKIGKYDSPILNIVEVSFEDELNPEMYIISAYDKPNVINDIYLEYVSNGGSMNETGVPSDVVSQIKSKFEKAGKNVRSIQNKKMKADLFTSLYYGDKTITLGSGKLSAKSKIDTVEKARLKAREARGDIGRVNVPLYNSGFSIGFEALGESEILNLEYLLKNNDYELGRKTNGIVYGNDTVIYEDIVLTFLKGFIMDSTLNVPLNEIFKHIKYEDIDVILASIMYSVFTNNFIIRAACINCLKLVDGKHLCNKIYKLKVNPKNLISVIGNRVSDFNRKMLANKETGSLTLDDIAEYQNNLLIECHDEFDININNEKIFIKLTSPDIETKVKKGILWIDSIIKQVDEALTGNGTDEARILLIERQMKRAKINTFIHYIESVTYSDGTVIEDDTSLLLETIDSLSTGDKTIVDTIAKGIRKYIQGRVIHIFGAPEFTCTCGAKHTSVDNKFDIGETNDIIEMDPFKTFSQLVTAKRESIEAVENII